MPIKPILTDLVQRQVRLSKRAFGPGARTVGLQAHIRKELDEIRDAPLDVLEWIDVVILGLDGAWRAMRESSPWMSDEDLAEMVARALEHKIGVNEQREWPDWRKVGQDEPIEHVKVTHPSIGRRITCLACDGRGKALQGGATCGHCGGRGFHDDHRVTLTNDTRIPDDSFGNGY